MGQGYAGPITDKDSGDGVSEGLGLYWGFSGMQGWRDGMEDAHIAMPSLGACGSKGGWSDTAMFGVMDGHGGESVALYCQRHLPVEVTRGSSEDLHTSLVDAFHRMDEMLRDPANHAELRSLVHGISPQAAVKAWYSHPNSVGCTAVVSCVRRDAIIVANAGDSRAVLCRHGRALELSEDHKPNLPGERARIAKAGGSVEEQRCGPWKQYRVCGNLNLSRSIGDLGYKQNQSLTAQEQIICSTPDVRTFPRTPGDEFMLIACDGVWDVLTSQEAVDHIRYALGDPRDMEKRLESGDLRLSGIVESLLDRCLSPNLQETLGLGGDNMTAVLVVFVRRSAGPNQPRWIQEGRHLEEWFSSPGRSLLLPGGGGPSWLCPQR